MDEGAFHGFLRQSGRSENAAGRAIEYVRGFETYLADHGLTLEDADPSDLESYVAFVEAAPGATAKLHLWGIRYFYEYVDDVVMTHVAGEMRRERVEQTPFRLAQFRGVSLEHTDRLAVIGIRSADELLEAAGTPAGRAALAARVVVPPAALDELVRLSDLARIGGIKSIRARLYLDAGVASVADLASRDPDELWNLLRSFVADTGFDGVAPPQSEVRHAIETVRQLPLLVTW